MRGKDVLLHGNCIFFFLKGKCNEALIRKVRFLFCCGSCKIKPTASKSDMQLNCILFFAASIPRVFFIVKDMQDRTLLPGHRREHSNILFSSSKGCGRYAPFRQSSIIGSKSPRLSMDIPAISVSRSLIVTAAHAYLVDLISVIQKCVADVDEAYRVHSSRGEYLSF